MTRRILLILGLVAVLGGAAPTDRPSFTELMKKQHMEHKQYYKIPAGYTPKREFMLERLDNIEGCVKSARKAIRDNARREVLNETMIDAAVSAAAVWQAVNE